MIGLSQPVRGRAVARGHALRARYRATARMASPLLMAWGIAVTALPADAQLAAAQGADAPLSASDLARFHDSLETNRFRALIDADWEWRMQDSPELASALGDRRGDDRLDDLSPPAQARRAAHQRDLLEALTRVDRRSLAGEDRLSFDAAFAQARDAVDEQRYPVLHLSGLSALDGVQVSLPETMRAMPMRGETDARHALARLHAMPARIAQEIARAREAKRLGWVAVRTSLAQVPDQIDTLLAHPLAQSPLLDPFARLPPGLPEARRQALRDEAVAALRDEVLPAYLDLRKAVVDELLPASTDGATLGRDPDGAALYALLMREQTTLALDPRQAQDLALQQMDRLHAAVADVMKQLAIGGSYADAVAAMNRDPQSAPPPAGEVLARYRDIAKRIDPELPRLFLTLPRMPYGVRAMGGDLNPATTSRYVPGALDGSTPGWLDVDLASTTQRPAWNMNDFFARSGVPGRHLQAARAHELVQLPAFRRAGGPPAYLDGWAFYGADLADELGLFDEPAARFGHLQAALLRTARAVVDVGLNALGWTRAQAVTYLGEQAGLAAEDAGREVDRCLVRPAAALAGMLGEREILELRRKAATELGGRFDERAFNQEVIDHGALPLPLLDQVIGDWIARVKR